MEDDDEEEEMGAGVAAAGADTPATDDAAMALPFGIDPSDEEE